MKDDAATTNYIRRYNEAAGNMDVCVEKELTEAAGGQIMAFSCNHDHIYVAVNNVGIIRTIQEHLDSSYIVMKNKVFMLYVVACCGIRV